MEKKNTPSIGYAVCDKAGKQVSKTFTHHHDAVEALNGLVYALFVSHKDALYVSCEKHARDYEACINLHRKDKGEDYHINFIGPGFYEVLHRGRRRQLNCLARWECGASMFDFCGQRWTVQMVDC